MVNKKYIFTSDRLGFRNWTENDAPKMADICADREVMRFFPSTLNRDETISFIEKMQSMFSATGYCYFAVDTLKDGQLQGFIGLCDQNYEAPFTPCVDIGWRLAKSSWGNGYATEGAMRCLKYAFDNLQINEIYSVATSGNKPSFNVMSKIGMKRLGQFKHPTLGAYPHIEDCDFYHIKNPVKIDARNKQ